MRMGDQILMAILDKNIKDLCACALGERGGIRFYEWLEGRCTGELRAGEWYGAHSMDVVEFWDDVFESWRNYIETRNYA